MISPTLQDQLLLFLLFTDKNRQLFAIKGLIDDLTLFVLFRFACRFARNVVSTIEKSFIVLV
jgi:hypothetical protein